MCPVLCLSWWTTQMGTTSPQCLGRHSKYISYDTKRWNRHSRCFQWFMFYGWKKLRFSQADKWQSQTSNSKFQVFFIGAYCLPHRIYNLEQMLEIARYNFSFYRLKALRLKMGKWYAQDHPCFRSSYQFQWGNLWQHAKSLPIYRLFCNNIIATF